MKLIHTSDWHLGHTLYNYDRSREQQAFLEQLARIVAEERPDAMVVSGDIYHYSTPSAATQKMYTDGMLRIHRACPEMTIVVTAGNHDSSSKLEIDSNLWNHFGVKVVGNIERTREEVNLEKHIVSVEDEDGNLKGYIVAVPHVYPQNFPMLDTETPREERQARFFQALLDEVEKMNTAGVPVVLMAHLSIEGSDRTGHDEAMGGIDTAGQPERPLPCPLLRYSPAGQFRRDLSPLRLHRRGREAGGSAGKNRADRESHAARHPAPGTGGF